MAFLDIRISNGIASGEMGGGLFGIAVLLLEFADHDIEFRDSLFMATNMLTAEENSELLNGPELLMNSNDRKKLINKISRQ